MNEQEPEKPDDVKARFKEALERKQGKKQDGAGGSGSGPRQGVSSAHGPAASQRTFRRKSGG